MKLIDDNIKDLENNLNNNIVVLDNVLTLLHNFDNDSFININTNYEELINRINNNINTVRDSISNLYQDFSLYSSFNIKDIGPIIAKILSNKTNNVYDFLKMPYKAVIWDWNEMHYQYIGEANEECYALVLEGLKDKVYLDNICLSYKRSNNYYDSDRMLCLGTINYDSINFQNIKNDKISFYEVDGQKITPLLELLDSSIYEFIDEVIKYRIDNKKEDISKEELNELYNNYQTNLSLKRK